MTVTQRLMRPGSFRLSLKPNTPRSITSQIDVLDHIVILPTRGLAGPQFGETLLDAAAYTGVIEKRPSRTSIEGCDPSWWLGTPAGRGVITSPTAVQSSTSIALSAWMDKVLPYNGITEGSTTDVGTTNHAGRYQWITRREALDAICKAAGAEWRMNPNFTVDAGTGLFVSADPSVVVTRRGGGIQPGRFGLEGALIQAGRDASKLATSVTTVAATGTGSASVAATGFVNPSGGIVDLPMVANVTSGDVTNLNAFASTILGSAGGLRTDVTVSTRSHLVPFRVQPGDSIYVYDPEAGITGTDVIFYRGEAINPAKVRCYAITWPIEAGMGVYVRRRVGSLNWVDISDWVQFETSDTFFEIGTPSGPFDDDSTTASTARLGANPEVSASQAGPGGRVASDVGDSTDGTAIGTTTADISGLSTTFTAVAGRRYLVTMNVSVQKATAGDAEIILANGSNTILRQGVFTMANNDQGRWTITHELVNPAAGSYTVKGRMRASAGTVTYIGTFTREGEIIVQDIGPA
jgi:hypothetical protein